MKSLIGITLVLFIFTSCIKYEEGPAYSFLTKEKKWHQVPKTKPFFHVEVKGTIEVEPFIEQSNNLTTAARRLNRHLSEVIFPEDCHITNKK